MRVRRRRRSEAASPGAISGIARVDGRTKRLLDRIQPGEIAVIDHDDLDRVAAEGLVEKRVRAVINAAESTTGRYPNLGALVLTTSGVPLIDAAGAQLMAEVREGERLIIEGGVILRGADVIAEGRPLTAEMAQAALDASKREVGSALERFAENTLEFIRSEREFLIEAIRLPEVQTAFEGRHVLLVVRGYGYKDDLDSLRWSYVRDFRPVLVGVDGGADALLEFGMTPDLIIGDMDSVTTQTLTCGAELVLHAYPGGRAPGKERLEALGLAYRVFESPGTSEDVAMLLAYEKGAELIVAVGSRASLIEMMDKGRKGMASTFLVRLRVGPKLVDAKGVSELHRGGPSGIEMAGLIAAALVTMFIVVKVAPIGDVALDAAQLWLERVWFAVRQVFA